MTSPYAVTRDRYAQIRGFPVCTAVRAGKIHSRAVVTTEVRGILLLLNLIQVNGIEMARYSYVR